MAGATSNDTRRAVDEARRMCDAGADVILTASPYYNRPTQDGLRRHFAAVADASSPPVVLYNVPGRAGVNLLPATAVALAAHANVIGIKEAAGDMHQALELLRLRARRGSGSSPATTGWRCPSAPPAATASFRSPRTSCRAP